MAVALPLLAAFAAEVAAAAFVMATALIMAFVAALSCVPKRRMLQSGAAGEERQYG